MRTGILRSVYCVSTAIILPYAFWVYTQERESFSRIPVTAGLLLLCVVSFYLYFATGFTVWRFSRRFTLLMALLFALLGIGFSAVLSAVLFSRLCEVIARWRVRRGGKRWSVHPNLGLALVAVVGLVLFPLLNDMYFRGAQARIWSPDYSKQNVFYGVNRDGFRGPTVPVARDRRPRILFLGNSSTFGWPYRYRDAFPFLVGEMLRARGLDAEVLNGATIGQSIGEIRHQLPFMLQYQPDLVFLMTGIHFHRAEQDYLRLQADSAPRRTAWRPVLGWPPMLVELIVFSVATSPVFHALTHPRDARARREQQVASFAVQLRAVVRQIVASRSRLILVDYPTPGADREVQEVVRRVARETHTDYLPLFDMLGQKIKNHLHDRIHPDRDGQRLIADAIAPVAAMALEDLECRTSVPLRTPGKPGAGMGPTALAAPPEGCAHRQDQMRRGAAPGAK